MNVKIVSKQNKPSDDSTGDVEVTEAAEAAEAAAQFQFKSSNPNHRVETGTVTVKDTFLIDPDIQRGEVTKEIEKFSKEFNPLALGTLTISVRENGVWSVVDGQQRLATSRRVGYTEPIPVNFHYGLSKDEEAQLFLALNDRRSVTALSRFKTRVTAQEPAALGISQILQDLGITVGTGTGFSAIQTADKVYGQKNGPGKLRWSLEMVQAIYDSEGKGGVYNGDVIEAFALIYSHYAGLVDVVRLTEKLGSVGGGIHNLIGRGRTVQSVIPGTKTHEGIAEAILSHYNKGKRSNPAYPSRLAPLPRTKVSVRSRATTTGTEDATTDE